LQLRPRDYGHGIVFANVGLVVGWYYYDSNLPVRPEGDLVRLPHGVLERLGVGNANPFDQVEAPDQYENPE
jgi:hypothetical protein